ncbi:hypothetical protein CRG98_032615 [Punica granatum]|uniref:Uncharacterized protein n=1 Tax=Punica granatum TaxID=22663 RepID=A0A2I0ITN4_PUNGR|nr:hypothetical protein CRG98_032615 [Punica granatum]
MSVKVQEEEIEESEEEEWKTAACRRIIDGRTEQSLMMGAKKRGRRSFLVQESETRLRLHESFLFLYLSYEFKLRAFFSSALNPDSHSKFVIRFSLIPSFSFKFLFPYSSTLINPPPPQLSELLHCCGRLSQAPE